MTTIYPRNPLNFNVILVCLKANIFCLITL